MSAAGFLAKLLNGGEVAWKPLGEVVGIQRGRRLVRSQLEETGKYAVFQNSMKPLGFYHDSNVEADTTFVICAGAAGEIGYSASKFWAADDVHFFQTPNWILSKYIYHWLLTQRSKISSQVRRASIPRLSKSVLELLVLPIPCPDDPQKSLAIQREIVRILDSFTELTAELTAELSQRKKQYNHYREQLLSFDEDEVEWKALGDVAEFRRGTAITKKQTKKGKIPVVANGPISTYSHGQHNRDGETVVVARSGAYAGYVSYWNQPIFLTDAFSVHPASNLLLPKFVFYLLQNKQRQLHDMKKGAGVPHVRVKEVEQYGVPIPSLTEQANIVAILDKFDTLTTSISEGLPREIELREKQYAWYRDQLLSFPKPDAETA